MPAKKAAASKTKSNTTKTAKKRTTTKKASPKKRATPKKKTTTKKADNKAGDKEVTIDRRQKADRREEQAEKSTSPKLPERREKVQRRRQIDPTTCERDYSDAEVEFMNAMDEYKRTSGRMFPTCSEVLEVIRDLGYVQLTPAELATVRPDANDNSDSDNDSPEFDGEEELEAAELAC